MNQDKELNLLQDFHAVGTEIENKQEKFDKLLDQVNRKAELGKAEAGLVYKYDDDGQIVRVDGLPLSRKERREFKRMEQRRLWKIHKAQAKAKWEKTKK